MLKINKYTRFHKVGLVMAIMLMMCVAAFGQKDNKLAQVMQENAIKLRAYSWKSRTEIRKGGETKSVQLNQMRYDLDGALQQTQISRTQQEIPTGGLRGMIAKKKKEEIAATLEGLGALAKNYGKLPPEKMQRFIANATITPERTLQQNLVRIQGKDVLQLGDSMTIWIDLSTHSQRRVEIQTTFENRPVRIISEFQDLPNGPTYMARSIVDYPSHELAITTENFEYTRKL